MGRRRTAALAAAATVLVGGATIVFAATITEVTGPAVAGRPAVRVHPLVTDGPRLGHCSVFPGDNAWNTDISDLPLHPSSDAIIAKIQSVGVDFLHPDFGENPLYGIPFIIVPSDEPLIPIEYVAYGDESDPGPFPIPLHAPIEGGSASDGDRHVIAVREGTCELFELFNARRTASGWAADSGARWDLSTGALRPIGWTSADAAGLPIAPGLVRYEEVTAGEIRHAIRVTFAQTRRGFVLPATHFASSRLDTTLPPMGLRLRLKSSFDVSSLRGQARVIAVALQRYGFIVADNGSNWFFQGATNPGWDDDDLNQLKSITGTEFEVVDTGPVRDG